MKDSRFFGRSDLNGKPATVTISGISKENVAKKESTPEMKWCLHIIESDKPFPLNGTNRELAALALKSRNTDDWIGKRIEIYLDQSVSLGGKLVGGLRVREAKKV